MSGDDDGAPPDHTPRDGKAPVGYGRPPAANRFKPGQSGNPRGRPRKAKVAPAPPPALTDSLAADLVLLDEAYRPIQLHEGGSPTTLSTVSAVYRAMAVAAVKGNRFAQRTFTERVQQAETRRRLEAIETIEIASKFKENWTAAFDYADRHGLPRPKVLPHPDDIIAGPDGLPSIVGPKDDQEQRHWDELEARAVAADTEIRLQRAELENRSMRKYEQVIFDDIVYEHRLRIILRHGAPPPLIRRSLGYRRPTADELLVFNQATKARYRLFAELTAAERTTFLREVERYDRKLELAGS